MLIDSFGVTKLFNVAVEHDCDSVRHRHCFFLVVSHEHKCDAETALKELQFNLHLFTQFAVKSYAEDKFLQNVTVTSGLPLTITDTSSQDGQGYWTRTRRLELAVNTANGLARLNSSGILPSTVMPNSDSVSEGSVNLYYTNARARNAISVSGSLSYDAATGVISYTASGSGSSSQLAALGLNVAPASGFELTLGGSTIQLVSTVTAASGVYTLDVTAANEFVTAAV